MSAAATVVIPMAGHGSRLAGADGRPKPLVRTGDGRTILAWALATLRPWRLRGARWVFVCLERHLRDWGLAEEIGRALPGVRPDIVPVAEPPEGQLCSVLAARRWLGGDGPLVIHNCDTFARGRLGASVTGAASPVPVFGADSPAYSYVRLDGAGLVAEVLEKQVCPPGYATTGSYLFRSARRFVDAAEETVRAGTRTNGEFYVSAVYRALARRGERFRPVLMDEVWPIGTPPELAAFNARLAAAPRPIVRVPVRPRPARRTA
jgi:NDP-sugar pyrophosphorylase family protein